MCGAGDLLGGGGQVHDPLTTNGGKKWQVQLGGDPEATDDPLMKVFFLDARNGWAMTDGGKILGTRDGSTWAELSTVSGTTKGVWFLTPADRAGERQFGLDDPIDAAAQRRRRQDLEAARHL